MKPDSIFEIAFSLAAKPFSVNNAYYRNRNRNKACRAWGDDILRQLMDPGIQSKLDQFRDAFNALEHAISVKYVYHYPRKIIFNREGEVSQRSMDLSNIEKLLQDLIFDHRFYDRTVILDSGEVTKLRNLNLNDSKIVDLTSQKRLSPTNEYSINISLGIKDINLV